MLRPRVTSGGRRVLLAVVLALPVLGGCTRPSETPVSAAPTGVPTTTRAQPASGAVGVELPFSGLVLTVRPPQDPAPPGEAGVRPDPGSRHVRVTVRAANRSERPLSFTPVVQAVLVDESGAPVRPVPGLYPGDMGGADVAPGQEVSGTISFTVPEGRSADRLVFTDLQGVHTTVRLR